MKNLLCISYRFPPQTYPLAIRVRYFLEHLSDHYEIDAVTAAEEGALEGVHVHHVADPTPDYLLRKLRQAGLGKLVDLAIWPDRFLCWVVPALYKARQLIASKKPDGILVFMMPYSQGIAGVLLKKLTGLPLVLNLNDSPTCSDMNATFPSVWHYRLNRWMEDWYVRNADAVVYVSARNMQRVMERHSPDQHGKFHLIRRGAFAPERDRPDRDVFRIVYTGGMGGWYWFVDRSSRSSTLRRAKHKLKNWLQYRAARLDGRPHSPVYIGKAIKQVIDRHPEWRGRIQLDIIGNKVDPAIVSEVLKRFDLQDLVNVSDPVPQTEAVQRAARADLLFLALPERVDGSPGGRISAKTYEYLMTDRPILAALPRGENREYLEDLPGVHLTPPKGVDEMAQVIEQMAKSSFDGQSLAVSRSHLWSVIDNTSRAEAFRKVVEKVL